MVVSQTVVKPPAPHEPSKKTEDHRPRFSLVELRGLEPLTPTLPGTSITPEQAGYGQNPAVVGVFGGVTVVRVVVKIVVTGERTAGKEWDFPRRNPVKDWLLFQLLLRYHRKSGKG